MVVEIDELFHHCAKAFLRSQLWDPDSWEPEAVVARRAVLAQQLERPGSTVDELDKYYGPSYAERLYTPTRLTNRMGWRAILVAGGHCFARPAAVSPGARGNHHP